MKKLLVTSMLAMTLLIPQQEMRAGDGDFWGPLCAAGAIVLGAVAIGSTIKNACKPYPHSEEIARGQNVEREARNCYNNNTHWYNEHPYVSYISDIKRTINTIEKNEKRINKKIRHLEKRQADLYKDRKLSSYERRTYEQQYDQLCRDLAKEAARLRDLQAHLGNLHSVTKTKRLKQEAIGCYEKYAGNHRKELNLLDGTPSYYMTSYQSDTLSRMIRSWYNDLPFISCYSDLTSDIRSVENTKTRVKNEMNRLVRPSADFWNYGQLRYDLKQELAKLDKLHANLCNVRAAVKTLPEYRFDQQEQQRREEQERRRKEEERRRQEERRRREQERRKEIERLKMQEEIRRLELKIEQLRWQLNHRPANCTECYIEELEQQIRDLLNERDRISVSFSW